MKRISAVIIHDQDGKALLQHRDSKAPTSPDTWGLWGGSGEPGESPVEVAVRELEEELSIKVAPDRLKPFRAYHDPNGDREISVFLLAHEDDYDYRLQEGDGMRFFSCGEIAELKLGFTARRALGDFFGF